VKKEFSSVCFWRDDDGDDDDEVRARRDGAM
jgi:hypothetical protein